MKVITIVGARPQFIKLAPVSRALRSEGIHEVIIHTGQHYDHGMSDVFFTELNIAEPDYNLGVGSGNHGQQTGLMLARLEEVMLNEKPDWVIVFGDTNSTLAGALAASKLHIPVAHVEAGLRSFNRSMPEEINRVLTDHLSTLLFCPTATAVRNLAAEGITQGVHLVGDVMLDALLDARERAHANSTILDQLGLKEKKHLLATVHRAENTDDPERLRQIMAALTQLAETEPVIFPVHPRTRKALESLGFSPTSHLGPWTSNRSEPPSLSAGGEGQGENSPNASSRSEPLNQDLGSGSAGVSPATSFAADSNEPARRRRSQVHGELRPPTTDAHRGHEPHQNPSPGLQPPSPHPMGRGQGEGPVHGKVGTSSGDGLPLSGLRPPSSGLRFIAPLGYLDLVRLSSSARLILTDSGGLQKEAYWLGVPCVTLRDETEWVETVESGWNVLAGANADKILTCGRTLRPQPNTRFSSNSSNSACAEITRLVLAGEEVLA